MRASVLGLSLIGLMAASVPAQANAAPQQESAIDASAAEALANLLVDTAKHFPPTLSVSKMEAQFALALANFNGSCAAMLHGIRLARERIASANARNALNNVHKTVARCNKGTGAGGDTISSLAVLPGVSTGGGSNYLN